MNTAKKKWCVIFLSFAVGIGVGISSVYFLMEKFAERIVERNDCLIESRQAQTALVCLKAIGENTNDFTKFHHYAHGILQGYVHDRDQLKKNYLQLPYTDDETTYKQAQAYLATHPQFAN